jgi:protein-disulfide isomerase
MNTRKQRQQEAREERARLEAEEAAEARRRRMTQLGAGAVLAAIVIIGALIAISQSGSDSDSGGGSDIQGAASIESELRGVDQAGTVLGDADAPVRIVEYGDLQCPVCREVAAEVIPTLIEDEVRTGDASLEFKNFTILGPQSVDAAKASLAAAQQGRYWEYIEIFYRNQGTENSGYVTDDFLEGVARAAGVADIGRWHQDRQDPSLDAEIADVQTEATRLGLNATPSFAVRGPGGRRVLTAPPLEQIQSAVRDVG